MKATPASVTLASSPLAASDDPPRGCSNFKLRQADRLVSRHYNAVMGALTGLKTSQYTLLSHIDVLGPLRPSDLAREMGLEPSSLTRNLQPLVAQGWVTVTAGDDARSRRVSLTPAGQVKRAEAKQAWKTAQLAFNDKLGLQRVAQLHSLLDECMTLLGQEDGEPPPARSLPLD